MREFVEVGVTWTLTTVKFLLTEIVPPPIR
jgi:hypothetical protein